LRYNQPFGISDPNAQYINGNPSTGVMGSIPPAASIELPQREIVNVIAGSGITPDNTDQAQLFKAMKLIDVCNVLKFAQNQGTASQWSAAIPVLPIVPMPGGTAFWFRSNFSSVTGGTQLSLNGSAFFPVVHPDLAPVNEGDIVSTAWLLLFFDGVRWMVIAGSSRRVGDLPLLQRTVDWYVNAATGNDSTLDGTTATVSGVHGPFRTVQRAFYEIVKYNMNGYDQNINIADGLYNESTVALTPNGSGSVNIKGNTATPNNVQINGVSGVNQCAIYQQGGQYSYDGIRISTPVGALDGLTVATGRGIIKNIRFGPCGRYHLSTAGGYIQYDSGTTFIEASAHAQGHQHAESAGHITINVNIPAKWPTLNILGPVTFTQSFIDAVKLGVTDVRYTSITGAVNVTGPRYLAFGNGVIDSIGMGTSYYPGSTAGSINTGGQYL
jgi:hypothetical protein